ncbi:DHHW family protein [Cohnella mopanensis]|uniref:DHHW family protein n=1 Tax=Cohnella mopanensis TaxID=2911966 RepID=UPI001EF8DDFF|nr:DHHW family protein [Cohnella mopanensis]
MKFQAKLNLLLFLAFIFGFAAINLLRPHSEEKSNLEQRDIMKQPVFTVDRFFDGEYTRDFDNYFADNFAFRTKLVQVGTNMKELKGIPFVDQLSIVFQGGDNMNVEQGNAAATSSSMYLLLKDRAFTAFNYSASAAEYYADTLNRFKQSIDPNVRVYSLLAPTSVEFTSNKDVKKFSDSQKDAFAQVNARLNDDIGKIDAYSTLADHKNEYIYFRTDHHWTALGAYYAYTKLVEQMGETPVPLDQYEASDIPDFLGTAYKQTLSPKLKSHPDTLTYYTPFIPYTYTMYTSANKPVARNVVDPKYAKLSSTYYAAFLGGDFPWGEITTDNNNGKRIVVIKDSYANAFVPFLLPHFSKVYYLDPRYYKGNLIDFVKEQQITDVLFLNNSTVARNTGISKILNEKMDVVQ